MDPRKKRNAYWRRQAQKAKRSPKIQGDNSMNDNFSPTPERKQAWVWPVAILVILTLCCGALGLGTGAWYFWPRETEAPMAAYNPTNTPAAPKPTDAPTLAPRKTEAPAPTNIPPTPVPPADTATPEPTATTQPTPEACWPSIMAKIDGKWTDAGETLYGDLGKRITFTNGNFLFPGVEPGDRTPEQLKTIETTWIEIQIDTCQNETQAVIFSGGFDMGDFHADEGVLFTLDGERNFSMRNGEIVLWFNPNDLARDVSQRITDQIKYGNLDIDGPLAFTFVTEDLKDLIPAELIAERMVEVVYFPK